MQKTHFPEKFQTPRLEIRKHSFDVSQLMYDAIEGDRLRLNRFLPWVNFALSAKEEEKYIELTHERWDAYEMYDFGIFLKDSEQFIGNIGMHSISWFHERCEVGYWLLSHYEGKGYMSEAVDALTNWAFELGFNRVEIRCDSNNGRSGNIPRRTGYSYEAVLQKSLKDHTGTFCDTLLFAKLRNSSPQSPSV